jgi:tRNA dimethylallyltransferase
MEPALARYQVTSPGAVLLAGPTASGKSAAALGIAARLNGTIINADSMQVYRELHVLTARPSPEEMARVPHRLYGIAPASEAFSVGRWLHVASGAIAEARREGRVPIFAGGTGLYFKTLLEGLARVPDIPPDIREFWRGKAVELGVEGLRRELATRDPAIAERLPADPQRLVRALEVVEATGVSLHEWQGDTASPVLLSTSVTKVFIAPERETVYAAIDKRFDAMIEAGAVEEVRSLAALGLDTNLPAMRAHGVPEVMAYLAGQSSLEDAVSRAKIVTRRYAKRQMTWARRFMSQWEWVPDAESAIAAVPAA